jgi:carbonic anhydrase
MREDLGVSASLSRRLLILGGGGLLLARPAFAADHHDEGPGVTPAEALKRLNEGNARYAAGRSTHPNLDMARRHSLTGGQHPFATILACADSRVGPELIFDQGLGDLFVARAAGNVVDDVVLGSIEYSVIHLGVPLVMVLGHQKCGAVTATIEALDGKGSEADKDTKIGALANLIAPAVKAVPAKAPDRLDAAILENERRMARAILAQSRPLAERARQGKLQVFSGRYSLDDGKVSQVQQAQA